MTTMLHVRGSGGSSGSQSQPPVESPDSLKSRSQIRILDLVSFGGEIYGFADKDKPLKCVYYNGTRVQNDDNTFNFDNVIIDSRVGTQTQDYIRGFDGVESEIAVGQELRVETPWTMTFTNLELSAIRVHLAVPALTKADPATGNIGGHSIEYVIELSTDGGEFLQIIDLAITGKTTSQYDRGHRIELPTANSGWTLRVRRITPNANLATISDTLQMVSYTEIIDGRFRYPLSAYIANTIDAEQHPTVPQRAYHLKGMLINVPSNYDPETRTYTGVWDGTFQIAYSNNPAWVFYDYIVNNWYGLGKRVDQNFVDKWKLYVIAKYCDELVPDGMGGMEPRFTCNFFAQSKKEAARFLMDLASVFRGIMYTAQGSIFAAADMPQDVAYIYNQTNVIDGKFRYSGSPRKQRHTAALVSYNDMSDLCRAKVIYVDDEDGIARYGLQQTEIVAVGSTSRGQAWRAGKMLLATERYETDVCRWSVGLDGTIATPGMIVKIADPKRAGRRSGGRIKTATINSVVVDSLPVVEAGDTISVVLKDGTVEQRTVASIDGATINVSSPFSQVPASQSVWIVESGSLAAQTFRVLAVTESDDGTTYTMYGVQHVPGKYAYVEQGIALEEPPINDLPNNGGTKVIGSPTGLTVSIRQVVTQNAVQHVATFSWLPVPTAVVYRSMYRQNNGNWRPIEGQVGTSVEIFDLVPGNIEVQVAAGNAFGNWSAPAFAGPFVVDPISEPPGYVDDINDDLTNIHSTIGTINTDISDLNADVDALVQDVVDLNADVLANAQAIADEVVNRNAAIATAVNDSEAVMQAQIDVVRAQVADIYGADQHDPNVAYTAGELVVDLGTLYRALQDVPVGVLITNAVYWEALGNYTSLGEAVASNLALTTQNANDINAQSSAISAHAARLDTAEADITTLTGAMADADSALAQDIDALEATVNNPTTGVAATSAGLSALTTRVDTAEGTITAQGNSITSLDSRLDTAEANVAGNASAISGLQTTVSQHDDSIASISSDVTQLQATVGPSAQSSVYRQEFANGALDSWTLASATVAEIVYNSGVAGASNGNTVSIGNNVGDDDYYAVDISGEFAFDPAKMYRARVRYRRNSGAGNCYFGFRGGASAGVNLYVISDGAQNPPAGNGWVEFDVYIQGTHAGTSGYTGEGSQSNPFKVPYTTTVLRPLMLLNWSGTTGQVELDYFYADEVLSTSMGDAINSLDVRVLQNEQGLSAAAADITTLETAVTDLTGDLTATANALDAVETRVTANEGSIASQSIAITNLQNAINDESTGLAANASAIDTLTSRVTVSEGDISALTSALTNLLIDVYDPSTGLFATATGLNSISTQVVAIDGTVDSLSASLTTLQNKVNDPDTGLDATSAALDTLASRVTVTENDITSINTRTTDLESTVNNATTGVAATSSALQSLTTRVSTNESDISAMSASITSINSSLAGKASTSALNALTTRVTTAEGDIDSLAASIVQLDSELDGKASSSALNALTTRVTEAEGDITAYAASITELEVRLDSGDIASAINALEVNVSDLGDAVYAEWRLFTNVNGNFAGMSLENTGATSNMKFQVENIEFLPTSSTGARFKFANSLFQIFDSNNVARIEMGLA